MPLIIRGAEAYCIIGGCKEAGIGRCSSASWGTEGKSKALDKILEGVSAACFIRLASSTTHSSLFFTHLEQGRE